MLNDIRNFIIDILQQIRLIFHHTHCESNCGVAACECDNSVGSSSSEST